MGGFEGESVSVFAGGWVHGVALIAFTLPGSGARKGKMLLCNLGGGIFCFCNFTLRCSVGRSVRFAFNLTEREKGKITWTWTWLAFVPGGSGSGSARGAVCLFSFAHTNTQASWSCGVFGSCLSLAWFACGPGGRSVGSASWEMGNEAGGGVLISKIVFASFARGDERGGRVL